ncbi:MAG: hypothetical protein K4571_07875 [Deltaproteobacteria bacterium]
MRITKIRLLMATLLSFVFSLVYNGLVHFVILGSANRQTEQLRRVDFSSMIWISLLSTLATSFLFIIIYALFVSAKNTRTGLLYGFCFGLFMALMVDLNQYVLYPLPFSLVAKWALFGIIEFTVIGLIAGVVVQDKT